MKKFILVILPICLIVGACDRLAQDLEELPQAKLPPLKATLVPCQNSGPKVIIIVATDTHFSVQPPHLCVQAGNDIKVNFTGDHDQGAIILKAKPFIDADWLAASNPGTPPDQATITVPQDTTDATYFYTVTAEGWGTIDPMITVH